MNILLGFHILTLQFHSISSAIRNPKLIVGCAVMRTERAMSLGRNDIDSLKETLKAQQELLQRLYKELDEERESSAIAADEALSMIVRLQGEKSAMEMEASQYKRIAEEKMCHAQEMLEMFQELIYQKEMQIASLEFQVQAYKFRLVSLGNHDLGASELQYPDNMLSRNAQSSLRRGSSLPPPILDALSRRASSEGEKSAHSSPKPSPIQRENTSAGDFNSYRENIKKLDERVKELANIKVFDSSVVTPEGVNENGISEFCPSATKSPTRNPAPENSHARSELSKIHPEKFSEVQACGESPGSVKVQDIFEVPQCFEQEEDGRAHNANEKIDWEKKPLLSSDSNNDSPQIRDLGEKIDFGKKPWMSPCSNGEQPKPRDGKTPRKKMLFKHPTYGVADFELHQLNRRLKQLADDRFVTSLVESNAESGGEELKLLREIREKVDSIQNQMMSCRINKPPPREDHSVGCIRETHYKIQPTGERSDMPSGASFVSGTDSTGNHNTGEDTRGYISIDCGSTEGESTYYQSDAAFIDTGVNKEISPDFLPYMPPAYCTTVRSFPDGERNCYTLKPLNGRDNSYLIRAHFMYGNYDGQNRVPVFNVYIGVSFWDRVMGRDPLREFVLEIIYKPTTDFIYVCLVNIGQGTPFISALFLRPLNNSTYVSDLGLLRTATRFNPGAVASLSPTTQMPSYSEDKHGRIWPTLPPFASFTSESYELFSTSTDLSHLKNDAYEVPLSILKGGVRPSDGNHSLTFNFPGAGQGINPASIFYVYWHFAETQKLDVNESRQVNIFASDNFDSGPITLKYMEAVTVVGSAINIGSDSTFWFTINKTNASSLPAFLNAFEIYGVTKLSHVATNKDDVNAIMDVKTKYCKLLNGWHGDPCLPAAPWNGVNCSDNNSDSPRITSLLLTDSYYRNLASRGLTGEMLPSLSSFTSLTYLCILCLDIAQTILDGNPDLCTLDACMKKSKKLTEKHIVWVSLAASISLVLLLLAMGVFFLCKRKRKAGNTTTQQSVLGGGDRMESKNQKFSYSEAELLMRVHHRNLVSLVGYCEEGGTMALIYEYMANGNLQEHLSGERPRTLKWKERLQISIDAAEGLEYLHGGCKPAVIHRDLKTANILVDHRMRAKLADFGISRIFSTETATHISTDHVAGTTGYLAPEYYSSYRLNDKGDVYAFGIILLELITGRGAVTREEENDVHIVNWVLPLLEAGDIHNAVDPMLQGDFGVTSAWKALEMAMTCVRSVSIQRPSMDQVLADLKECLLLELARENSKEGVGQGSISHRSFRNIYVDSEFSGPSARYNKIIELRSEVVSMANNFHKIIGQGGSATVYHGFLKDGTEVAVKILNGSSTASVQYFQTEAYASIPSF
ncbi:hypothetical protein Cgig2_010434 [Carnegiea gigantea]|uniref:Protein kinase domain-containing protein n=1 Tax=Carnegiea gigantea TaxID=171969 RepID=A0A9Q1GIR2_9CARY|nr:hypothetical protein Cgig2_010434 [Carnegiea gigantea]